MTHTPNPQADAVLDTYSDVELMAYLAGRISTLGALRHYLASVDPDELTVHDKIRILNLIQSAMSGANRG
jgi:hypothetical protein